MLQIQISEIWSRCFNVSSISNTPKGISPLLHLVILSTPLLMSSHTVTNTRRHFSTKTFFSLQSCVHCRDVNEWTCSIRSVWFTFGLILILHAVLHGRVFWWMNHVINIYTSPLNYECAINQKRFFEPRPRPLNSNPIKAQGKACSLLFVRATGGLLSQYTRKILHIV